MSRSDLQMVEGALGLAARGIPVIALRPRSKAPIHRGWPELGLLDPISIQLEWSLNPDANVGVLCGRDAFSGGGLTVLDIDQPDGPDTLRTLEAEHQVEVPLGPMVETPTGGWHHYLAGATVSWNPGPGLEVRSIGRQCAAPPSIHPSGGEYLWQRLLTDELPDLPAWLIRAAEQPRAPRAFTPRGLTDPVLEVPPPVYFEKLTGLVPDREGFVACPFHGEQVASLRVYATADRGWFCYGETCRRGGDVVNLVVELAGAETPVRGYQFVALLDYLRGRLL